jgi:release factor glutamine methyltransferase
LSVPALASIRGETSSGRLLEWAAALLRTASDTARIDAELLLAASTGLGRAQLRAFPERVVAAAAQESFEAAIRSRLAGVPVAYLIGRQEFYSLEFSVCPAVLIPRPETELLVERALAMLASKAAPRVLDLGTGSGAIAVTLKHHCPAAEVTAVDVSAAALDVARTNARTYAAAMRFLCSDWFSALAPAERFDLIAANPPYVAAGDPHLAALAHEPRIALEAGPDGLAAIGLILAAAGSRLRPGGSLLLEHGYDQRLAIERLARSHGLVCRERLRDLAGHDRGLVFASA